MKTAVVFANVRPSTLGRRFQSRRRLKHVDVRRDYPCIIQVFSFFAASCAQECWARKKLSPVNIRGNSGVFVLLQACFVRVSLKENVYSFILVR